MNLLPRASFVLGGILFAVLGAGGPLRAVVLGQVDDFEDGTTRNWRIGQGTTNPINVAGGGPAGAGDDYLLYTSNGLAGQVASRMIFYNRIPTSQWIGDYLAEGINVIQMDVTNRGNAPLVLRVGFNLAFGSGGTWWVSTDGIVVDPSADWTTVSFSIGSGDMTRVSGASDYDSVMSAVNSMRILSSASPNFIGDTLVGTLGVDNITAVPEPSGLALLAGAAGLLGMRRRR